MNLKSVAIISVFTLINSIAIGQLTTDHNMPTVKTANGTLMGTELSGISMFKGVPYAQPPVGDLRWKEPQPVKNWEGTAWPIISLREPCSFLYTAI